MKKFLLGIMFLSIVVIENSYADWTITAGPFKLAGGEEQIFMRPEWSPNGNFLAFTGPRYQGLWVLELSSGKIRQISDEPAAGFGFQWSESGTAIATRVAAYENRKRLNALKIFDLQTAETIIISDFEAVRKGLPRWTDNDRQVYAESDGELRFFESGMNMAADSKSPVKTLPFLKNGKIALGSLTEEKVQIFDPLEGKRYINLAVSPDGRKIAFEVVGGNLYVMSIDGSALVDLGIGYRPRWSPDSQYLVYMVTYDDGYEYIASDLFTIKIDGSEKTNLTATDDILEMNPGWSPDGKRVAFDVLNEGAIYMVIIDKR